MIHILNLLIVLVQLALLFRAIRIFNKNPLDFGALFIFIYIIFYALAMWDNLLNLNLLNNEFFKYYRVFPSDVQKLKFNAITTGIMLFFEIGYSLKRRTKGYHIKAYNISQFRYKLVQLILVFLWIVITYYGYQNYGGSLRLFFSPARKTIYTSGYLLSIVVILPTTLVALSLIKHSGLKKRNLFGFSLFCIMMLMTQMSLGQRREIINGLIFIVVMIFVTNPKLDWISNIKANKKLRKKLILLGIFVAVLIPLLWYARTYTTQIQRGETKIIMPWEIRGWFELLFGSSTTGFQTTFIIEEFTKENGPFWLHSVIFMFTSFIPRALFPAKLMTITKTMQFSYGIEGNMSLFYVNDIYFNFGIFSFIMSFLFGYFVSYFYNMFIKSKNLFIKAFGVILLAQIILLFKNGFAQYLIMITQYYLVFGLTFLFIRKKNSIWCDEKKRD